MEADGVPKELMVTKNGEEQPQEFIIKDYNDHIELYRYISTGNTHVDIPDMINGKPVTVIGAECFSWHEEIESVSFPETVTEIGSGAFSGCRGIRNLILPDQITEIGLCAFRDCKNLKKIVLPAGLKRLRCGMFAFCYLDDAEVVLKEGLIAIESSIFFSGLGSNLKLRIPDSVKEIAVGAFELGMEITTLLPYDKGWFMKWPYGESVTVSTPFQQGKITDLHYLENECFLTEVTSGTDVRSYFYPSDYADGMIVFDDMENRKRMEEDLKRIPEAGEIRNAWRRGLI